MMEQTTEEIVKALRCCAETHCVKSCPRYYKTSDGAACARELMREAAATVESQQREIERIKEENKGLIEKNHNLGVQYDTDMITARALLAEEKRRADAAEEKITSLTEQFYETR